jgi:hypothetical protein
MKNPARGPARAKLSTSIILVVVLCGRASSPASLLGHSAVACLRPPPVSVRPAWQYREKKRAETGVSYKVFLAFL